MAGGLSVAIDAIWEKSREQTAARIATLDAALAATLARELGEKQRVKAQSDAHKLAGSLGMFGASGRSAFTTCATRMRRSPSTPAWRSR